MASGSRPNDLEQTADWLERATQHAQAQRPREMLEALATSRFLDGLFSRLNTSWRGRVPREELQDCVGFAVDSAYATIAGGGQITSLGAWIWKAASNRASTLWRTDYSHRSDVTDIDSLPARAQKRECDQDLNAYRIREAIRQARMLLPRIGSGQVIAVIGVLIDSVEQGVVDLPAKAIAETLGLSEASVRSLLARGLERLTREASASGLLLPSALPDSGEFESSDSEEDDAND